MDNSIAGLFFLIFFFFLGLTSPETGALNELELLWSELKETIFFMVFFFYNFFDLGDRIFSAMGILSLGNNYC